MRTPRRELHDHRVVRQVLDDQVDVSILFQLEALQRRVDRHLMGLRGLALGRLGELGRRLLAEVRDRGGLHRLRDAGLALVLRDLWRARGRRVRDDVG